MLKVIEGAPHVFDGLAFPDFDNGLVASFRSFHSFVNYVESLSLWDAWHNEAWAQGEKTEKFRGTPSMLRAFKLAREGWKEGLEQTASVKAFLNAQMATRIKSVYGVAGGVADVPRMLAGDPLHMKTRKAIKARRVLSIISTVGGPASMDARLMATRAAVIAWVIDALENTGYSCQLTSANLSQSGHFVKDDRGRKTVEFTDCYAKIGVTLKEAGESFDINAAVFGLGHPSMHRRFVFAALGSNKECKKLGEQLGFTRPLELDEGATDTFIAPKLTTVKYASLTQSVRAILREVIAPMIAAGLPLDIEAKH